MLVILLDLYFKCKVRAANLDSVVVELLKEYCLPLLLYGS